MDKNEIVKIGDDVVESIKSIFPLEDVEYDSIFDGMRDSYVCRVNWKLKNDQDRPNKPARIILIIISREAIDDADYWNRREIVQGKFRSDIQTRYRNFDPDHNEPYGVAPPVEEWRFTNWDL